MYVWSYFLVSVQAWAWVLTFLGLGMRAKTFGRPLPRPVSEAAMPFFIVHQPVILAVAFAVVRWGAPLAEEWVVIAGVSFVLSAALAVALARLPVVSTMFGVKTRFRKARASGDQRPDGGEPRASTLAVEERAHDDEG
jgi:peptidoglycan/LPS O-acetylase OafA/YrhL